MKEISNFVLMYKSSLIELNDGWYYSKKNIWDEFYINLTWTIVMQWPMDAGYTLSWLDPSQQDGLNQLHNSMPYLHVVGCLMHTIVHTRHDCAFIVCSIAQHLSNFDSTHWKYVKWVLRYINGTFSFGTKYCKNPNGNILIGYSNAAWVGDNDIQQSTLGYCFLLVDEVVSWANKKEAFVALSSNKS